ncbi:LOW QUALITY PROTEIN: hypothetical protein QYF61_009844 [Mycteria americana]|uniref:RNA-directed DNA polymerase from mobile element jockey n=1 Tax=Mycteria americana TaxID=33587 RepID=A0AAN7MPG3_MYCAM|nr:LOW QUALITY PROTEIN: hypothetical protein QYF61_009844 [Mycteria americana]
MNLTGKLVTADREKAEVLSKFLPQSSLAISFPTPLVWVDLKAGTGGAKSLSLEDQVRDPLRNLNIHKSMGPDEMHPRVLRELVDPLSVIFEKSWQSGEVPGGWKKGSIAPISKKGRKEDPGNYRPVSLTSVPGKITDRSSWKLYSGTWRAGRGFETASMASPMAFCDGVTTSADKGRAADVIYLGFCKASPGTSPVNQDC